MDPPESSRDYFLRIIKGRWIMALVSIYILFCSGATYIFGIYSGAIKAELGYDQSTIDTLSFFKDLGANVGIVSGLMNEILPPWSVLAVGAFMNLFGYVMIWLAVTHRISKPRKWQMNLYLCVGANSQTFANTAALVTVVKNFPNGRGEVLGIVKGCVGLSGAIFTQLYLAIYGDNTRGVILLVAWLPSLVTLLFMFFVRPITPAYDKRERKNFYSFLSLALLLAAFLMVTIIVENQFHRSLPPVAYKVFGAVTVAMVIANIGIGLRAERSAIAQARRREQDQNLMQELSLRSAGHADEQSELKQNAAEDTKPPVPADSASETTDQNVRTKESGQTSASHEALETSASSSQNQKASHLNNLSGKEILMQKWHLFYRKWPQRGEDFTIMQAICSADMWILFISLTCGVGATLTAIDNMGQIGESQGYSSVNISTCVALISIWNFLGRVIAGFVSEILLRRYHLPRTFMLSIVLALACVGHLLIAFPGRLTLYVASIMVGLCFGAQWPLLFAIISELFGLKYYATLYNVGAIASPVGSYVLNVKVAGHFYDKEARRQLEAMQLVAVSDLELGELKCVGAQCFRLTFLIMTMVSAFASLVSLILVLRTRRFYSQDIYKKFKLQPENQDMEYTKDSGDGNCSKN